MVVPFEIMQVAPVDVKELLDGSMEEVAAVVLVVDLNMILMLKDLQENRIFL